MISSKIICNKCFIHLDETRSNLHVSECGHVFCRKCLSKLSGICAICSANGVRTVPISSAAISHLLVDVPVQLENLLMAVKFQQNTIVFLFGRIKYLMNQYSLLKTAYWQRIEQRRRMIREFQKMKEAHNALMNQQVQFTVNELPNKQQMNFGSRNVPFGSIQKNHDSFTPNTGVFSENSDESGSTIKSVRPLSKQNGVFRAPTATRTPRSDGMSTGSSRASTPMSNHGQSSGRSSDSRVHFRRHI